MLRSRFDEYIARFNAEDATAFDEFLAPDMHMQNGTLEFTGVDGMKHHYQQRIWPTFREVLTVPRFVSDERTVAIQMITDFTARCDDLSSLFGPVLAGETFQFNGVIMYRVDEHHRFADILVAYNSFTYTNRAGKSVDLGIPH